MIKMIKKKLVRGRKNVYLRKEEREELGEKIRVLGKEGYLLIFSEEEVKKIEKSAKKIPYKERREFIRIFFSKLWEVEIKKGKISIPSPVLERAFRQ